MSNPVCPKCGNRVKFVHRTVEYEMCWYDEHGNIYDANSFEVDSSVPVWCGVCDAYMEGE